MSVIVDVIINTDQAEQQLQDLQQQIANDLAQGAARIGTTAGQAATATARAAGKNATEEFLRAFDPDKLKAELESAGLDEQQIEIILETTAAKAETQKLKDTIASAFGEASGFATDALKQITAQAAREVNRAAGKVKSVTEIVDGVQELNNQLQQVEGASGAAAEGIGQLVLNETVDKFGDLKDIFEKTGVALGGLSQEAVDAAVKVADIAEYGAQVGAAFGPMGAAVGLVAGGMLGMFNAAAEETLKKSAELKERITETTQAIVGIGTAAGTGGQSIEQLTDLQEQLATELATKTYPALGQYQIALRGAEEAVRAVQEEQSNARSAAEKLADAQTTGASAAANLQMKQQALAAAQRDLRSAQDALNKAKEASLILDYQLGRSAEGVLKDLRSRYDLLTKGNPLLKMSAKELEAEVAKLDKQYNELAISAKGAADRSFMKGEGGQTAAEEAAAAAEAFEKLSEATSILDAKRQQSRATTTASTKATTEDTKAKEANLKPLAKAVTEYDKLVELEKEHEAFLKRQKQTAAEGLFGMDYLDNLAKGTGAAAEKVGEETTDLIKMIELGGRTIAEKVQDDIDALREAKKKAADDLMDDQLFASFSASVDARMKASAEAIEKYKLVLQPYADFVGSVFNTFVDGLAEGQSATEAFAKGVQQAVAAALAALAKEFGVKSLGALAEGFAALSNPFTAAAAPGFFKSAALYAAAAAAAGVGSAVVSSAGGQGAAPSVGGGGGGSVSSSGGVGGTSNSLGGGNQQSAGTPSPIVVDLRGAVFPTSDLTGAQQFGEAVARSLAAAAAGNQPLARRLIGTRGFVV